MPLRSSYFTKGLLQDINLPITQLINGGYCVGMGATLLVSTLMILYFMDARLLLIILIWIAKALFWEKHKDD